MGRQQVTPAITQGIAKQFPLAECQSGPWADQALNAIQRPAVVRCLLASVYQLLVVYNAFHCHTSAHKPLMAVLFLSSSSFGLCCEVSCSDMTLSLSNAN